MARQPGVKVVSVVNVNEALAAGATLLTVNRRLFLHLRERYDAHQARAGREVWPTADILPFSAWLRRCWEEGREADAPLSPSLEDGALLLSETQEGVLWEQIIARGAGRRDVLQPAAAARLARQASQLLAQWRLDLPPPRDGESEETQAFRRWRSAFQAACAAGGWLSPALLPEVVAHWIETSSIAPPARLLLAGFDEFTPQQAALLEVLRGAGCEVSEVPPPDASPTPERVGCPDVEAEIETAARWARRLLEAGDGGSIGIVVPELGALRARMERIFTDVLAPGAVLPGASGQPPFNISHGRPLARFPLVEAALAFLGLGRGRLPMAEASRLILSPFLAGAEQEAAQRALLDAHLRQGSEAELSLAWIATEAGRPRMGDHPSPHHAPVLAAVLTRWQEAFAELRDGRKAPGAWAEACSRLLRALGWPEQLKLDSVEHQAWEKLLELFSEFAALEPVLPALPWGEALTRLHKLAAETQFQPEGGPAQVQILGALEAGGLAFDHLWVLGLHEDAWPRPAHPNPFLPAAWQREQGLPQSSAAREAAYARRITARLLAGAGEAVVSHPLAEGERALRPSRLIAHLPGRPPGSLSLSAVPFFQEIVREAGGLETLSDHDAPPLAADRPAAGGSGIFKDQAACPFRAFATHRLHAQPLASPAHGLDPSERGSLIHKVLERIWARLETLANLRNMPPEALHGRVAEAVEETLADAERRHPATLRGRFREIERARLIRLTEEWLEQERERAPFTVIAREREATLTIGGIEVNTRIDRIDQLEDMRHVVLDYKSGKSNWKDWLGERPEEPQLPLYCSSAGLDLAAVAFAQVRRGDSAFRGLEAEAGILPRAERFDTIPAPPGNPEPPDRDTVLAQWHGVLENLGNDFRRGAARVDPKDPPKTCRYCELTPLCRIHDVPAPAGEEEDDGG